MHKKFAIQMIAHYLHSTKKTSFVRVILLLFYFVLFYFCDIAQKAITGVDDLLIVDLRFTNSIISVYLATLRQ